MFELGSESIAWDLCSVGSLLGVTGVMAGLLGSVLTAMSWFWNGDAYLYFHDAGTLLLILVIPLLIIGASCLDEADDLHGSSKYSVKSE